jgi:hypothetical protein
MAGAGGRALVVRAGHDPQGPAGRADRVSACGYAGATGLRQRARLLVIVYNDYNSKVAVTPVVG